MNALSWTRAMAWSGAMLLIVIGLSASGVGASAESGKARHLKDCQSPSRTAECKPDQSTAVATSVIYIKFANDTHPPIAVIGDETAGPGSVPYGVYDSGPSRGRAGSDQATLDTPPPDPTVYKLEYGIDAAPIDTSGASGLAAAAPYPWQDYQMPQPIDNYGYGYGVYGIGDGAGSLALGVWDPRFLRANTDFSNGADQPRPSFNRTEYQADLAQWQRDRARALARASAVAPPRAKATRRGATSAAPAH